MPVLLPISRFDAVIFDMDGVITRTADVHAAAWKSTFDEVLEMMGERDGGRHPAFDIESDYLAHVDGKPRRNGIRDFLASRGIELPEGEEGSADLDTVEGVARKKNRRFREHLERHGVDAFDTTVDLVRELRRKGIRTGVISSSRNCEQVLRSAGVSDLFETRVDGVEMGRLGLPGKPDPEIFLEAARRLGVAPERAVVVEDAVSGVQAGSAGGFGLVIGVDRGGNADALRAGGADVVVRDLGEVEVEVGEHTS